MREESGGARKMAAGSPTPITLGDRLLWLCPVVGLLAGAVVLWFFGLTLWTAIMVALLFACPLAIAGALLIGRRRRLLDGEQP